MIGMKETKLELFFYFVLKKELWNVQFKKSYCTFRFDKCKDNVKYEDTIK